MKIILSTLLGVSTLFTSFTLVLPVMAVSPHWDTTGDYVIALEYLNADYLHDMTLTQDGAGKITGNGGSPAGTNSYLWTITSGNVVGNSIELTATYTATPDAVTPQTIMDVEGVIAANGTMSGTWTDNYAGGNRSGTWKTTSGTATEIITGSLVSEDFGVVSYDTGSGILSGYTAGFSVANATLANVQSVVVKLYSGTSLLQTNTAILSKFNADITGTQFSSPFDVSGNFNYPTDGYWTNIRANEYGQSLPATKVVATITLSSGKVVTATNTTLIGDPSIIYNNDNDMVTVTISKYVQGMMATAVSANNADFPMASAWTADNTGSGTGSYVLSETNTIPYQAVTAAMTKGADYETKELVNGNIVGAQCATGKPFALQGYTVGNTQAEALAAAPSMAKPSFTNLQHNKFVIVWNRDCSLPEMPAGGQTSGQISGDVIGNDGILAVTSIEMINTTAIANGSFTNGWKYIFHITAPMSEKNLAMKFNDWIKVGGNGVIPVAGNMRISSPQANNNGATILLTAANTYSTQNLTMTTDLDPNLAGRQVKIIVEVAVPIGTPTGSYTTSYGVQSNP